MNEPTITYTFNYWLEFITTHGPSSTASKLHLQNKRIAKLELAVRDYLWSLDSGKTIEAMNCYLEALHEALQDGGSDEG